MSVPPSVEERAKKDGKPVRTMPFVPHFALRDLFGWTVALALLAGLSAFLPWELGHKADPFKSAPAGIQPEWYFLWTFQALKYMPAHILGIEGELVAIGAMSLGALALVILPFLDRNTRRSRAIVTWAAIARADLHGNHDGAGAVRRAPMTRALEPVTGDGRRHRRARGLDYQCRAAGASDAGPDAPAEVTDTRARRTRQPRAFKDDVHAKAGSVVRFLPRCEESRRQLRPGRADRHRAALREVSCRRRLHAQVRAAGARRSVRPVSDQRARQADGQGRDARRDLQRLPSRARHRQRARYPIARGAGECRADLRGAATRIRCA